MFKSCTKCKTEKPFEAFYKKSHFRRYPTSNAGYDSHCKACIALDRKEAHEKNPKAKQQSDRKQHLKRYGLTPESYNSLFLQQNGSCPGCDTHQSEFNRNLVVDHDHVTGKVRGLLCVTCNLLLGYAQDQVSVLQNLIKYLQSHNSASADKTDVSGDNVVALERKSLAK